MIAEILSDEKDIVEPSIGFSFSIYNTKNEAGYVLDVFFSLRVIGLINCMVFRLNVFSMF